MPHKQHIAFILGIMLTLCPIVNNAQVKKCWMGEVDSIEEKAREEKHKEGSRTNHTSGNAQYSGNGDKHPKPLSQGNYSPCLLPCLWALQTTYLWITPLSHYHTYTPNTAPPLFILYCSLKVHC